MTLILTLVSIIFTYTYVSRFLIPWNYFLIKSYHSMTVMIKFTLVFWKKKPNKLRGIFIYTITASSVLMIVSEEMACHSLDLPLVWAPPLTHWGRDKMDAISQTTSSSAFPWMKMFKFRLKFQWSLFLRVQLTIFQHWFRWWLGAVQATSHYLNQWWLV